MKYLDEFRDGAKAGFLLKEIEGLTASLSIPDDRPLQFMEVCGGHTHSIFRYGVEGLLPRRDRARARARAARSACCRWAASTIASPSPKRPGVIFTTFGDAMRVPGSRKSLLQAKADGADVRMVYSPMDALQLRARQPRPRGRVLRPRLRDHDAVDRADDPAGEAEGIENFSVFCNHITIVPTIKAMLDSPDLQLDGFLGPGHVSMVIGTAPYEFIAQLLSASRWSSPGFEPLDVLQSIWMLLKQIKDGRAEIENQYARVVPETGNAPALSAVSRGLRAARVLRVARPGLDRSFRRQAARGLRPLRRRAQIRRSQRRRSPIPKACQCGEVLKGVIKPHAVQGVRHSLHAGDAARRADGFVRRRLRRLLSIWRASGVTRPPHERRRAGPRPNPRPGVMCQRSRSPMAAAARR